MPNYDDVDTTKVTPQEWAEDWEAKFKSLLLRGQQKRRACAVDAVVLNGDKILLVKRKFEPYKGSFVLPGGYVDPDETVEQAVAREVKEETGVNVSVGDLIGVYSDPKRDSRQNVSIAFVCDYISGDPQDSIETGNVDWWKIDNIPSLGFDHDKIVQDALCIQLQ